MNKKCLFIALFLLACMAIGAAEVKVLKTTPGELSFDMQGMYANVELQLQVSNVGEEVCVCVMLLNNGKWKDDGMTMQRLVDMAEGMCFGDAPIDDSKKQQNGKKGKVKEKDAPAGSSLLDFFGF